jgi:hypothetical protein
MRRTILLTIALAVLALLAVPGWGTTASQEPFPTPRGQFGGPERLDPSATAPAPVPSRETPTPPPVPPTTTPTTTPTPATPAATPRSAATPVIDDEQISATPAEGTPTT